MKKYIFSFLVFLPIITQGQKVVVKGYIKEEDTKESLIGAYVISDSKHTTTSNEYGFFSLYLTKGKHVLKVKYIGFKVDTLNIVLNNDTTININLRQGINKINEILVKAESNKELLKRANGSTMILSRKEIHRLSPLIIGETDLFKSLQTLPGIQGGREGSSDLYIRGGDSGENLVLIDGVPIYYASHLLGMLSAFNNDAIKKVNVIKGGFPARYGGRLSSVIDIRLKDGNKEKYSGILDMGILSSKITFEGPIYKKSSFLISGRISPLSIFSDLGQNLFSINSNSYLFHDLTTKFNQSIGKRDKLYLSYYESNDNLITKWEKENNSDFYQLRWKNRLVTTHWTHQFGKTMFYDLALLYSNYKMLSKMQSEGIFEYKDSVYNFHSSQEFSSSIKDIGAKLDFRYIVTNNYSLRVGAKAINKEFLPNAITTDYIVSVQSNTTKKQNFYNKQIYNVWNFDGYIENVVELVKNIEINIGLYSSKFMSNDTNFYSVEPRFAFAWKIKPHMSVKLNYTKMQQNIHLLGNTEIGVPTDIWVPSTKNIFPEKNEQVDLGLYYAKDELNTFIEIYYKKYNNIVDFSKGTNFLKDGKETDLLQEAQQNWEDRVLKGNGYAYGLEFFFKKNSKKFNIQTSYSLSWSWRLFDKLNNGVKYPFRYNRRHNFNIHLSYNINKSISINAAWTFMTGFYNSIPISKYTIGIFGKEFKQENYYVINTDNYPKNNVKAPDYHRLDFSFSFEKKRKKGIHKWTIGVYNLYNRRNTFALYIEGANKGVINSLSLFPILPVLNYSFSF